MGEDNPGQNCRAPSAAGDLRLLNALGKYVPVAYGRGFRNTTGNPVRYVGIVILADLGEAEKTHTRAVNAKRNGCWHSGSAALLRSGDQLNTLG